MQHYKLTRWCIHAVQKIKYPPDREKVYWELRQHLDDRCEDFLAQGMDEDTAAEKAWEVMGDPYEVADYLAAVHRPFWGYAYSITKWLCIAVAAAAFFVMLWDTLPAFGSHYRQPEYLHYDPYADTAISNWKKELHLEPDTHFSDSGWHVTLDKAAFWRASTQNGYLFFQLKIQSLLHGEYFPNFTSFISARDSLGREYACPNKRMIAEDDRFVSMQIYHSNAITWLVDAQLEAFDPEGVEWVDILYECDGRTYALRIDLTGGRTK